MAHPPASNDEIRRRMERQARRDTGPEMALRRELHRRGLRYRVHRRPLADLRRTVDIVFAGARVAVEVRGCFWHVCPEHATIPQANREWWIEKLERNRLRDADTDARLREAGWQVVVVWEHENPAAAADRVVTAVRTSSNRTPRGR